MQVFQLRYAPQLVDVMPKLKKKDRLFFLPILTASLKRLIASGIAGRSPLNRLNCPRQGMATNLQNVLSAGKLPKPVEPV